MRRTVRAGRVRASSPAASAGAVGTVTPVDTGQVKVTGQALVACMDRLYGGPFTWPVYRELLNRVHESLSAVLTAIDAQSPVDRAPAVALEELFSDVSRWALAGATAGTGGCGARSRYQSRDSEDPMATRRAQLGAAHHALAVLVDDDTSTATQLQVAAAGARGCPPDLAARLLAHPHADLPVLAALAIADAGTGERIPACWRTTPLTVADTLTAAGGPAAVLAQLAPTWQADAADLADVAAAISA